MADTIGPAASAVSPFCLSQDAMGRTWHMSRGDGSVIANQVRLLPNGKIAGGSHANESMWRFSEGHLEFCDERGKPTTRFTGYTRGPGGEQVLVGSYQLAGSRPVMHFLTEVRHSIATANSSRVAVLVRAHTVTQKLADLLKALSSGIGFDLYVCADETKGPLDVPNAVVIGHSVAMCGEIGLLTSVPNMRILYYFGDYAFYCAYECLPGYDYYIMIEYDVDFTRGNSLALEGIINRLQPARDAPYDLVASHFGRRPPEWGWGQTCGSHFTTVYGALFPFIILSRRALCHVFDWRRREASSVPPGGKYAFCEALVPSALAAEERFRCANVTELVPGAIDSGTFRIGTPMLLGALPRVPPRVEMVHPVFSEAEYLGRLFTDSKLENKVDRFADFLSNSNELPLAPDLRAKYLREARMLVNARG